jgi:hypothetical protein
MRSLQMLRELLRPRAVLPKDEYNRHKDASHPLAPRNNRGEFVEVEKPQEETKLTPLEKLVIVALMHVSRHHKLINSVRVFGKEEGFVNPHTFWDHPDNQEEIFHRHPDVFGKTDIIAMAKASKHFPAAGEGGERIKAVQEYLELVREVTALEEMGTPIDVKKLNEYGSVAFSIANDVVTSLKIGDVIFPMYQERGLKTNEQHFQNLRTILGANRIGRDQSEDIECIVEDSLALQEMMSGVGAVERRRKTIHYKEMNDEFLTAVCFGIQDSRVGQETAEKFLQIWNSYVGADKVDRFKGWTPEKGCDPTRLAVINGGLPNQLPFFKEHIVKINDVPNGSHAFPKQYQEIVDIVTGNPTHLNKMIRSLLLLLVDEEKLSHALKTPTSERYKKMAQDLNESFGKPIMSEDWVDLSPEITMEDLQDALELNLMKIALLLKVDETQQ